MFGSKINDPSYDVFGKLGYENPNSINNLKLTAGDKYAIIEKGLNLERARIEDEFGLSPIEAIIKREDMLWNEDKADRLHTALDYVFNRLDRGLSVDDIYPEKYVEDMNAMLADDFAKGVESIQTDAGLQQ